MNDFMKDGNFYIGANYWASHAAINMWSDWRADVVDRDLKLLSEHGVKHLRMFLLWPVFQPLHAIWANSQLYELRMGDDERPLPDTEAGRAGVSEEACRHFDEFCAIAEKYGVKLIVGLLTGHMSFRFYAPPAFEGRNFLTDPTLIKWEIRFVRYFVKRFADREAIEAWDLGNECPNYGLGGANPDQSYVWAQAITSAIRESDPTRPVVSGYAHYDVELNQEFNIREQSEMIDVNTTHPYQIFSKTSIDPINTMRPAIDPAVRATFLESLGGKPTFIEEVGSIGYTNCSERTEAAFLRTMLWSAWAQGNRGVFWWCAFDQGKFDFAPYDWNNYGSDYGLFRDDGSAKPVALEMKEFNDFLANFEYASLPAHTTEAVCIVQRDTQDAWKIQNSAFILAKQANIDLTFCHADEKLPDSDLYIMPSIVTSKPIFHHRLNELLERVRNGATLYFSMGGTLFRRFPELTGLKVASREKGTTDHIKFGDETFDIGDSTILNIESIADSCEVLATAKGNRPVYVRNSYGKGWIYFLAIPLELQLTDTPNAFRDEKSAPYYRFYESFATVAASKRAVKSTNPMVLTTEHPLPGNKRIVVAVNYSDKCVKSELKLQEAKIILAYRGNLDGSTLSIPANDAAVLLTEKIDKPEGKI